MEVAAKLAALEAELTKLGSVLVCYSGGVDSAFVLAVAHRVLGRPTEGRHPHTGAVGMTAVSPSLAPSELEEATKLARSIGADHRTVESQEIHDPSYQANAPDRCFHCKSELYRIAEAKRGEWGLAHVLNGTNRDDLGDYRPGLEAAKSANVKSPLVDLGFTKSDVREGAKLLGLEIWDKPAAACLSSRIPFGTRVTPERLEQIATLESALHELGFRRVRVRFHPGADERAKPFARIELDAAEIVRAAEPGIRDQIVARGKAAGFLYVTLDLGGYRMGSHNEALPGRSLPVVS